MAKLATTGSSRDAQAGETILAPVGQFLIIVKLEEHDIRAAFPSREGHDEPSRPSTDGSVLAGSRFGQRPVKAG